MGGTLADGDVLMTLNSDCFGLVRAAAAGCFVCGRRAGLRAEADCCRMLFATQRLLWRNILPGCQNRMRLLCPTLCPLRCPLCRVMPTCPCRGWRWTISWTTSSQTTRRLARASERAARSERQAAAALQHRAPSPGAAAALLQLPCTHVERPGSPCQRCCRWQCGWAAGGPSNTRGSFCGLHSRSTDLLRT